jgi:hypothetical protein
MQKKVLGGIFLLLSLGLGAFFYSLLSQKIEVKEDTASYESPQQQLITPDTKERVWIKEMALKDAREFIFPVNELFMQIDQFGLKDGKGKKAKSFRLTIDRADRYSLFCIIQTLNSLHLPYMVIKEGKIPLIYLEDKSEKHLEDVVLELEKYDIKSKIVEVWL